MSAVAVLASRYLHERLRSTYPTLPAGAAKIPRMHEFILTLEEDAFAAAEAAGIPKSQVIPQIGKLFLDFGFHAPTVAFPEIYGLMIEPTETESRETLDHFIGVMKTIAREAQENPELLHGAPHDTPNTRLDEARAARKPDLRWRPSAE